MEKKKKNEGDEERKEGRNDEASQPFSGSSI